ncbi:DUF1289 domain-containing protein [Emcibacter sp.]|uniref:DUF1289 domain-containing protein n=1 Tax=Emcibacter sp. TaxID=1979954 RepID=UPI003A927DA6
MTNPENIESPCIGTCQLDETGEWCIGCGRLRSELFNWQDKSLKERSEIISGARQRLKNNRNR